MESFIIYVAERGGSGRIAELADMASRERSPWILAPPHASIRLLVESILLPAHRAVSDGAGNGATVRRSDAYCRDGNEIDKGDEGDCHPGNR